MGYNKIHLAKISPFIAVLSVSLLFLMTGCKWSDPTYKHVEIAPNNIETSSVMPDEEEVDYFNMGGHYSPYPLVRFARPIEFENKVIKPGFYLLKLYYEAGVEYLLFKKEDKLVAAIPIDQIEGISDEYKDPSLQVSYSQDNTQCMIELKYQFKKYSIRFKVL